MDPVLRVAHHLARLVAAAPNGHLTSSEARRRLAGPDRARFVDACVQAVTMDLIRVADDRLTPGSTPPLPERRGPNAGTAERLAAALAAAGLTP